MAAFKGTVIFIWSVAFAVCISAAPPSNTELGSDRRPRQDEDSEAPPGLNFGAQVAQIIAGVFTGNLDSIIKGSFGFIQEPNVNKLSHNTWEQIKSPWVRATTTAAPAVAEAATEPVAPTKRRATTGSPPLEVEPETTTKRRRAPPSPVVEEDKAHLSETGNEKPGVYSPDDYPTKSPVRTTQPTYPTLASLVETTTERESIIISTTEEDDEEEGEGVSFESADAAAARKSETGKVSGV